MSPSTSRRSAPLDDVQPLGLDKVVDGSKVAGGLDRAARCEAAVAETHRSTEYALRARAHAIHAEVHARAGNARHAYSALERAWTTVDQLPTDQRHAGFNADRLNGFDGSARSMSGNPATRTIGWNDHW